MASFSSSLDEKERQRRLLVAKKVLEIYSPSGEESMLARFLKDELSGRGLDPRIDPSGNILCEIGSGPRKLLLCPHLDTVPGKLPVKIEGNLLYGRGACDAKGALLSMLFAFEDLAKEFEEGEEKKSSTRVIFAGVVEEERESRGLNQLIKDNVRADAAIFGEPCGLNRVAIGYRGHVPVSFEIKTEEAHASAPWTANNAAELAFSLYEEIREKLSSGKEAKNIETISTSITGIHSGTAHNVIPGVALMSLDVRLPIGTKSGDAISKIKEIVSEKEKRVAGCEIKAKFSEPSEPYRARMDSRIVRAINRSLLRLGVAKPSFISKSGTGDMNKYAASFGVDAVTYGPGNAKLSHRSNEFVDVDEVLECANVLIGTVHEFASIEG